MICWYNVNDSLYLWRFSSIKPLEVNGWDKHNNIYFKNVEYFDNFMFCDIGEVKKLFKSIEIEKVKKENSFTQ